MISVDRYATSRLSKDLSRLERKIHLPIKAAPLALPPFPEFSPLKNISAPVHETHKRC